MPMSFDGSCHCGAVRFSLQSHTPVPYQRCYCSICRKTQGGGGYAVNIGGLAATLEVEGQDALGVYRATIERGGRCEVSKGERNFCTKCGAALWLFDPRWPDLVHPFASAIDTALPVPPERVHLMLEAKPDWVEPDIGPNDRCFAGYPEESLDDWHRARGLWIG